MKSKVCMSISTYIIFIQYETKPRASTSQIIITSQGPFLCISQKLSIKHIRRHQWMPWTRMTRRSALMAHTFPDKRGVNLTWICLHVAEQTLAILLVCHLLSKFDCPKVFVQVKGIPCNVIQGFWINGSQGHTAVIRYGCASLRKLGLAMVWIFEPYCTGLVDSYCQRTKLRRKAQQKAESLDLCKGILFLAWFPKMRGVNLPKKHFFKT